MLQYYCSICFIDGQIAYVQVFNIIDLNNGLKSN